ncbi:MAG: PD-(D/E)XK nuclease family protein [Mariprofundaceae bacterium]|nr:PD-(D/E)XK nuclease family protein [Mariprofundaceae bacterium]
MNEKRQWQGVGLSPGKVLKCLHAGATLIAATPALAADWKQRMVSQTTGVVATPDIVTWRHWLTGIASFYPEIPVALTAHQEIQLWEQIIRRDLSHNNFPRKKSAPVRGLARHASEAWMLMQEYHINVRELTPGGEEAEAMVRWIHAMKSQLGREIFTGRTLAAEIPRHLDMRFHTPGAAGMVFSGGIILDGFESLTPMQRQILGTLQQKDCDIFYVPGCGRETACTLTACPDESGELLHIAKRVKRLLDQDERMRILVLTAESGCDVTRLRRALDHVLISDTRLDPARDIQAVVTAGDALSRWPMIEQALHLLSLAGKRHIGFDDFSPLLFFPWLSGYEDERMGRASLDVKFRKQNRRRLSLDGLLKSEAIQSLPSLLSVIRAIAGWKPGRQSAAEWVKIVHALLLSAGFVRTGLEDEQPRSNPEIRQMNAFRDVLSSLVALDAVDPALDWSDFLSRLRASCAETRLGRTPAYPNVVVMPLHQVAGMQSGHVFVMGMDEEAFPPAVRPYPLLPVHLQRKYGIPMIGGAQVFESSRWLWTQLLQVAPAIECSYARQKDEREMLPSSFVAGWPETGMEPSSRLPPSLELEMFEDAPDVSLQSDENIYGGSSIIRNQSACPFRAFATHRLGIAQLGETEPGIEATARGALVHLALEFIWRRLKSQSALLDLTETRRAGLLDAAIDHAWREKRIFRDSDVQAIEKKRMRHVLSAWLDMEATRPPFEVCEYEKVYTLTMPEADARQFPVHIKVDRIDRDGTGRRILIDYKTGHKQPVSKWLGERMEEPQLPLYALAAGISADDAVTFATVRSGDEMGFEGLTGADTGIAGVAICDGKYSRPEDWPQVLADWRVRINALAREFVVGRNTVAPRDSRACAYCGLEAVCRIEETGFESDIEDES